MQDAGIRKGLRRNGQHILAAARATVARVSIALLILPSGHHIRPQAVGQPNQRHHSGGFLHRLHLLLEQDNGVFQGMHLQRFLLLQTTQGEGRRLNDSLAVVGVLDKGHLHSSVLSDFVFGSWISV